MDLRLKAVYREAESGIRTPLALIVLDEHGNEVGRLPSTGWSVDAQPHVPATLTVTTYRFTEGVEYVGEPSDLRAAIKSARGGDAPVPTQGFA